MPRQHSSAPGGGLLFWGIFPTTEVVDYSLTRLRRCKSAQRLIRSGFNSISSGFFRARLAVVDFHSGRRPFLFEPSAIP
jgi:hypothetical protein